jgi:hypothetical protein
LKDFLIVFHFEGLFASLAIIFSAHLIAAQQDGPYISADGDNLTIFLPAGASVTLNWLDNATGVPVGSPIPIATADMVEAVHRELMEMIENMTLAEAAFLNQTAFDLIASQQQALQTLETDVVNLFPPKISTNDLSVLDGEIQNVVIAMVANVPVNNTLKRELDSKLTSSPTCQCFNPTDLANTNTAIDFVMDFGNKSWACEEHGLIYNSSSDTCVYAVNTPNCGVTITNLDPHATAICGQSPRSTMYRATCLATCNSGYTSRSASFTCGSDGLWSGSLSCPGNDLK